eukprot:scaffold114715_cov63-Phaeocystis_antarctica.AAC.2
MVMVLLRDRSSSIQLGQQGQSGPRGSARARPPRLLRARLAALGGSSDDAPRVRGRATAYPSHRLGCSSAPPPKSPIPPPSAVQVRGLPRLQDLRGQPAQGGPRAQRAAAQPAQAARVHGQLPERARRRAVRRGEGVPHQRDRKPAARAERARGRESGGVFRRGRGRPITAGAARGGRSYI